MRKKRKYFLVVSWLVQLLIHSLLWKTINGKGIGVIGKGGGSGEVCLDCAGNYTEDELKWSLIVLSIILSVFLLILCSQCCSRLRARLSDDEKCSEIPAPTYRRRTERRIYRI